LATAIKAAAIATAEKRIAGGLLIGGSRAKELGKGKQLGNRRRKEEEKKEEGVECYICIH
jgi:hypothetical protein